MRDPSPASGKLMQMEETQIAAAIKPAKGTKEAARLPASSLATLC